jgi:hypothetical protein
MLRHFWLTCGLAAALALTVGGIDAAAAGSATVLKFYDPPAQVTGVGFNADDPNAVPPVGGSLVLRLRLENIGTQFGKPNHTIVGRVLIDCTVLTVDSAQSIDGICAGIAHLPNGYLTFAGNGIFTDAQLTRFAITGGVGPYANDRGQIKVVNNQNGSSVATVTLT